MVAYSLNLVRIVVFRWVSVGEEGGRTGSGVMGAEDQEKKKRRKKKRRGGNGWRAGMIGGVLTFSILG